MEAMGGGGIQLGINSLFKTAIGSYLGRALHGSFKATRVHCNAFTCMLRLMSHEESMLRKQVLMIKSLFVKTAGKLR